MNIKGKLKTVKTLDEASIIIILDPHTAIKSLFYDKAGYLTAILRGVTYPEETVHFLTSTNPRNNDLVTRGLLSKTHGLGIKPFTK